jgi:hypothetical protein
MQLCVDDILAAGTHAATATNASFAPSNGAAGLTLAAWVAEQATGQAWSSLFEEFQAGCGCLGGDGYPQWAVGNPWLAGGLEATPRGYAGFLAALLNGTLLDAAMREQQWRDWAPAGEEANGLGEWRVGLGVVLECAESPWNVTQCGAWDRLAVSGASKLGFYPYIANTPRPHFVLIARPTEVNFFNSRHALAMAIVGATCFVIGAAGSVLAYCSMEKQKKEEKNMKKLAAEAKTGAPPEEMEMEERASKRAGERAGNERASERVSEQGREGEWGSE